MKTYLIIFCLFFAALSYAKPNHYTLKVTEAKQHLAEVVAEFNDVQTKAFTVKLPVWRTGKYQILDLVKNIRHFKAFDANDKPLVWQKDDKNSWRVFLKNPGTVKITYQIYANDLKSRVSHIDETHAFLDASGVFIYSESQRDKPLTVELRVDQNWRSVSGMESSGPHTFIAENYDQLVDSPIETGLHQFDSIKVDEQIYEIVIWGDGNFDMGVIKNDIKKLHHEAKRVWKTFPFKRYVYMYHVGEQLSGATEHVNSTIIQADRFGFFPENKYRKVIATTAHEFVHTWNVKSYRPAGITPYDYSVENYSDLFWIAEGKTSYYDNLLPVRSGIFTVDQYLENMAADINRFINKPGRNVMSLAEASFDTWLPNDLNRLHNTTVSIYLKGSLVSWLLDKEIRKKTDNDKSLDDLSLMLYQRHANKNKGYTSNDVKKILKEITGDDFSEFWQAHVIGIDEVDFDELLEFYGLAIEAPKEKKPGSDSKPEISIGMKVKDSKGLAEIVTVDTSGPAWQAGLTAGDKIIAINDKHVNVKNLPVHLENLVIGSPYSVHYFNQGILKQTVIKPIKAPQKKLKIVAVKEPTKKQKKHFNDWLKQDFDQTFTKKDE